MRIILNKADDVDEINLMKMYVSLEQCDYLDMAPWCSLLVVASLLLRCPMSFAAPSRTSPTRERPILQSCIISTKIFSLMNWATFTSRVWLVVYESILWWSTLQFDRMTRRVHKAKCLTILEAHLRSKWSSYYFRDPTNEILDNLEETISEVKKGYQFADGILLASSITSL